MLTIINLEMRLCPILAVMEKEGVKINVAKLAECTNVLRKKLQDIEKRAHETAGHPFVLSSLAQTREVLFNELKLDEKYQGSTKLARTQVNNFKSTSESVLQHLQDLHPLPRIILEHRQIMKLKSTYVDGILSFVENGCLYTTWQHTAAATGRLTSANPNIQNIPKQPCTVTVADKIVCKDKEDTVYTILAREPFISEDGWSFVAADFQSIELRLLAHLSEDPTLLAVFQKPDCNDIFCRAGFTMAE
ncbi:DNA polymerase nu-like isoform X3 [Ptychodera flava]|uniref:DNA polymerase nu-like isoform X3 n=1 Tax=Ptychodera flava TaxID=63121 RepID=UPI00396A28F8